MIRLAQGDKVKKVRIFRAWFSHGSGAVPGTGLGAGFESGLCGTSRRRDHSIPERTRLRTSQSEGVSTGSTADGSAALPSPGLTDLLFSVVIL